MVNQVRTLTPIFVAGWYRHFMTAFRVASSKPTPFRVTLTIRISSTEPSIPINACTSTTPSSPIDCAREG
jgi:hypothetical protein